MITRFRTLAGDHGVPPFYPDSDIRDWLNEAEREAAERARLLTDTTTIAVVRIPLEVGQREYFLHPKVFDVEAVSLQRDTGDRRYPVLRASQADIEWSVNNRPNLSGWGDNFTVYGEASGSGTRGKRIIIDRKPDKPDGFLWVSAVRYPLVDMEDGDDEPEISPRHHDGLVDWALHRAYSTRDMEFGADRRAAAHEAKFIERFGQRADANVMRKQVRHRAPRVRPIRLG